MGTTSLHHRRLNPTTAPKMPWCIVRCLTRTSTGKCGEAFALHPNLKGPHQESEMAEVIFWKPRAGFFSGLRQQLRAHRQTNLRVPTPKLVKHLWSVCGAVPYGLNFPHMGMSR